MKFCYLLENGWTLKHHAKWNKPDTKWQIRYGSTYIKYLELIKAESRIQITDTYGCAHHTSPEISKLFSPGWWK